MPLWEYSLIYGLNDGKGQERDFLDRWGKDGWELVCIVPAGYRQYPLEPPSPDNSGYCYYYFKRPRERAGIVGRLLDAISFGLIWGTVRSSEVPPQTMPRLEPPGS
ncbi:MAG TPA: hypothetical protein VIB79_06870 [Candidatus Binatia bacterium]|jgi:hypothetical protein